MRGRVMAEARCLSDLRFDALLGDELSVSERGALLSHVDVCAACRDRLSAVAYERSCFLTSEELAAPSWLKQLEASRAGAPTPWRLFGLIAFVACALLAGLHAQRPKKRAHARDRISVYAERGGDGRAASRAEPMRAGDVLRFAYTAPRARELAILSLAASGDVKQYFPSGERSRRVEAGVEALLPAVPLAAQANLAGERIYALFCDASFALAPLRVALAMEGALPALPRGCLADALTLGTAASQQAD